MWLFAACAVPDGAWDDLPAEPVATPAPAIDAAALTFMQEHRVVGLGVGIIEAGAVTYLRGYGWQTWPDAEFSSQATRVRWASLSKSVTAAVAADAAVHHGLDLDADLRNLRPSYEHPANWDGTPITLRLLLGHLAGTRHYGDGVGTGAPPSWEADDPAVNTGMAWALPYWIEDPLVAQPGEQHHYSSHGYNLAGVVLEEQLGAPLDELARALLFDPLAMTSMAPDQGWVDEGDRATGYTDDVFGNRVPVVDTDVSWKLASGGWHSTTADLARWCAGYLGDAVLDAAVKAELWREGTTSSGEETGYGLGFDLGGDTVAHSGGNEKATTRMKAWPEEGRCIVLMANTDDAPLRSLMDSIELLDR